jgi:uncharacterized protein DUF6714
MTVAVWATRRCTGAPRRERASRTTLRVGINRFMRRIVAELLAPRICRDTVMVVITPVAADGLALLHAGMVWSADYDRGRLLGEVGLWDLFAGGHAGTLRGWASGGGRPSEAVRRAIFGEPITGAELEAATHDDRALILLADHAAGRPIDPAAVDALTRSASDDTELRTVAKLQRCLQAPASSYRVALTDEPILPVSADAEPAIYRLFTTGDLAGCVRGLEAAIERARAIEATGTPYPSWPRIAEVCRFLTGDDDAAMAHLERARFADVRDDWVRVFGPLGTARVQREKDLVLAAIEQAFDGVPFPGPRQRSLYQAEAADHYAGCDQSRDHTGRWQDLPRQHLLDCQWALPHLGAHSLPYYLPAIMSFVVREHDQERGPNGPGWIFESIQFHLQFERASASARAYHQERHRLFTRAQFGAIARFAEYYRCSPADRQCWRALAHGGAWPELGAE